MDPTRRRDGSGLEQKAFLVCVRRDILPPLSLVYLYRRLMKWNESSYEYVIVVIVDGRKDVSSTQ